MDIPVLHRNLLKYCNKTTCTTPGLGEINLSTPAVEASCDSLTSLKKKNSYIQGSQVSEEIRVYPMHHLQFVGA